LQRNVGASQEFPGKKLRPHSPDRSCDSVGFRIQRRSSGWIAHYVTSRQPRPFDADDSPTRFYVELTRPVARTSTVVVVPVFVVMGVIGVGLILFALRPGPWVLHITEESLRRPPHGRYSREWWSEAELERRAQPWSEQAKDLIDWAAVSRHAGRLRPVLTRRTKGAARLGGRGRASTAML